MILKFVVCIMEHGTKVFCHQKSVRAVIITCIARKRIVMVAGRPVFIAWQSTGATSQKVS